MMSFWCFYFAPINTYFLVFLLLTLSMYLYAGLLETIEIKGGIGIKWIHEKKNQPAITCTKLTLETLEQGVQYVQS